jgi:ankyrin repeat protein
MPERPASSPIIDNLKKEAKRWLHAIRAGDADARARLDRAIAKAPREPTLRDVQFALARERGFAGWKDLTRAGPANPPGLEPLDLIDRFLEAACPDHHVRGRGDHLRALHTALRLLEQHPALARANFITELVTGNLPAVQRAVAAQPTLARLPVGRADAERGGSGSTGDLFRTLGPKGWHPLLFLCFTRLPLPAVTENAVPIATLLLEAGADPTVYFQAGGSRYTPLVGVLGAGEEDRPPHQLRDALVSLLLQHGADPFDNQVIYNISFGPDVLWYLQRAYARSVELGRASVWDDPEWEMIAMGGYGTGARWHLELAIDRGDVPLARWCLEHGANPESPPGRTSRLGGRALYEEAMRAGQLEIAELLARHGAKQQSVRLTPAEQLAAAAFRHDRVKAQSILRDHPELLTDPFSLFAATSKNHPEAVTLLLDLGLSPDLHDAEGETALHVASSNDAVAAGRILLDRGAAIDPVESRYGGTPLGRAVYYRHRGMIDLLAPRSRDIWELAFVGKVERLRALLAEHPELGRLGGGGQTPLMWLPAEDEEVAIEIAKLFLAHGADPTIRNPEGMTAADRAARLGMSRLAEQLRAERS